jgi:hypothetical protein
MATARREEIERTLAERVAQRVAGRGVPRQAVDTAVARVLDALPASALGSVSAPLPIVLPSTGATILVAVTARSVPDLGSRLRAALVRDGIEPGVIGLATAGNHNVATFRIPTQSREATARAATALGYAMTVVSEDGA